MRSCAQSLSWVLFLFTPFVVFAIFVDEAYEVDYHHALLGTPRQHSTFFHRPSAISKASLLYTISERGVLGAVNPKDGSIVWRQRLVDTTRNQTFKSCLSAAEGENTIFSAANGEIRAWDAADGKLVWNYIGNGEVVDLKVLPVDKGQKDVVTLHENGGSTGFVRKLMADSGEAVWVFQDDSGDIPFGLSSSENSLWYISLHAALLKGSKIKVTTLDLSTGKQAGIISLSSDNEAISSDMILHIGKVVPLLVWVDRAFKALKINVIGTKRITTVHIGSRNRENIQNAIVHSPQTAGTKADFLVHYQSETSHWAEVYHVDLSSGAAKKAYDLPPVGGRGAFSTSSQGTNIYFTRSTNLGITLFSSATDDILGHWPVSPKSQVGLVNSYGISHAVSEVISRGASSFAVRSALVLSSGDWELVRNGDSVWIRPEGLAGVVAAAFGEFINDDGLAEELSMESHSSVFKAYAHRLKRHIKDLEKFPAWAGRLSHRVKASFFGETSSLENQGQTRDGFGFQKLILLATEKGRVIGLDTGNQGRVIWSMGLVDLSPGEKWKICNIEMEYGTALIQGCNGDFWLVQILDGAILKHQPRDVVNNMKASISILDALGGKIWVPVHSDGSLGHYRRSELPEGTLIVTKGDQGVIQCWRSTKNAAPTMLWDFNPSSGETISNVITRPAHDPVASIGKALGDRNVMYKYLNPNVLLIATVNPKLALAKIHIFDSSSGQILHVAKHSNVDTSQPITAIISENWVAYSLFSDVTDNLQDGSTSTGPSPRGFQLVISELFESQYPNDRGPLGSRSNFSTIYPTESENGEINGTPHVISQAYSIPGLISQMSVTSTLQGITPRSLLCFLPSLDAIIAIPRTVLDPRRPIGRDPVPVELEEGLFKHNAVLEFEPKWIVNHKRDIMSLSSIMTAPSFLESTSLLFSFGDIDIFGTRVTPIGGFDILGKGFSKMQLVGTVIALAIGTGIMAPIVRKKQIDSRWKS